MKKILLLLFVPYLIFSQDAKEIAKKCMPLTVSLVMEDNYKQPLSLGSGFVVGNGKIVTNVHVIENANYGYVTISGETKKHNIEGYYSIDRTNDLILLSVPTLTLNTIEFASTIPEIGEKIYVIGNPKGLSGTISEGIISGIRTFDKEELIQITAPISPGSSGGPVIDNQGKLVGVSVGTLESGQNLNFAIPTKYVSNLIKSSNNQITKLNVKSIPKKVTSNIKKNVKEGIQIINIEWYPNTWGGYYTKPIEYVLEGFSIKNNLQYEIRKVKMVLILRNSQGIPIDSQEFEPYISRDDYIKPFLSKYIKIGYPNSHVNDRIINRKPSEKLEIRILDFTIEE